MNDLEKDYVDRFRHHIQLAGILTFIHEDIILEYRKQGYTVKDAAEKFITEANITLRR